MRSQALINAAWISLDKITRITLGSLLAIWIAKQLGPSKYGIWSYSISFVSLFQAIASLGIQNLVVRDLIQERRHRNEVIGTVSTLIMTSSIASFCIALIFNITSNNTLEGAALVVNILSLSLLFKLSDIAGYLYESTVRSRAPALISLAVFIASSYIRVQVVRLGLGPAGLAAAHLVDVALVALALLWQTRRDHIRYECLTFSSSRAMRLIRESTPLFSSNLFVILIMNADTIAVARMASLEEAGIYGVSYLIVSSLFVIPMALASSVFPSVVESHARSLTKYYSSIRSFYLPVVIAATLLAAIAPILAIAVTKMFLGDDFSSAPLLALVLSPTIVFVALVSLKTKLLTLERKTRSIPRASGITLAFNLLLLAFMTPKLGSIGAAIAVTASWMLYTIVYYWPVTGRWRAIQCH